MIIAEIDTRNFSFQVVANNEQQAKNLWERAWKQHCTQYDEADPDVWESLWDGGINLIPLVCGTVLRDHTIMFTDPNGGQFVNVAVVSHRHGFDAFVGEEQAVKARLRQWADDNWSDIEGLCDTPEKPKVMDDDTTDTYFEISCDSQGDVLEYNDVAEVMTTEEE